MLPENSTDQYARSTSLTPFARPSAMEFQPARVKNAPTDPWAKNVEVDGTRCLLRLSASC